MDTSHLLGDVERLGRAGEPVVRVGPGQCLDAEQRPFGNVPDRLVGRGEPSFVDQAAHDSALVRANHGHLVADVIEVRDLVAALPLGLVQCGVGLGAQQIAGVARPRRAHADRDLELGLVQAAQQPLRQHAHAVCVGVRQEHGELVSADAEGAIPGAPLAQHRRDALEDRIAVGVTVPVVDELEVVDVEGHQRQRVVVAGRRRHRQRELILKGALVRQVGQAIARCALQGRAVAAHQRAPPEEVEHAAATQQCQQAHQQKATAEVSQLRVEDRALVVTDLECIATVREVHGRHELEIGVVQAGVPLMGRIRLTEPKRRLDADVGVPRSHGRSVARCANETVRANQQRLERARAARGRVQHLLDPEDRLCVRLGTRAERLERQCVAARGGREALNLRGTQLPIHEEIPHQPDQHQRSRKRHHEPNRERRTAAIATIKAPASHPAQIGQA